MTFYGNYVDTVIDLRQEMYAKTKCACKYAGSTVNIFHQTAHHHFWKF